MKIIKRLIPADVQRAIVLLVDLDVLSARHVLLLSALITLAVVTEAFGLFMVLPILQFISSGSDLAKLADQSEIWSKIANVSSLTGFPVTLASLSAVAFILICLRQVCYYGFSVYLARLQERATRRIRIRAFSAALNSRGTYLDSLGTGTFVHFILQLCAAAGTAVGSLSRLGLVILSFIAYGTGLLAVAPKVTLIVVSLILFFGYLVKHFRAAAERTSKQLVAAREALSQFLAERYSVWRLIKLSATEENESELFADNARQVGRLIIVLARMNAMIQLLLNPLAAACMFLGLYFSVEYFGFSVAEITIFILVFLRVLPLVYTVLGGRQQLVSVTVNLSRARLFLDQALAETEPDDGRRIFKGVEKAIVLESVSYNYGEETRPALTKVNLRIPARAITAITGPSGSGKSTLVDLLPRILEPQSGRILVDDTDLKEFKLASLRRGITYVPQTPLLFGSTIGENVRYGNADATNEEFIEACEMAFVDEFVSALPDGYETRVGEGGSTLSGGQRQRIALARAFLAGGSILVLDEPTSALDEESEERIKKAIKLYVERHGAVVIIIAHRLSTIENADQSGRAACRERG